MQLSLVVAFIPIVNILWCGVSADSCILADLFQQFGYSRECVVNSLASLLLRYKVPTTNESSLTEELALKVKTVTNTLTAVKTLLQEAKSEPENAVNTLSAIMAALENVNPAMELPKNCAELKVQEETSSGVQTVYPYPKQLVYCDQATDGGGWTVIQRRSPLPIRENFQRNWTDYVEGFGDLNGEFWIGLDNIHALTNSAQMELRIDLEDWVGQKRWAHYATFHVGDAASEYVLRIEGYTGDAEDAMTYPSDNHLNLNGMKFSTHDNDNDQWSERNCAEKYKGGWWYNRCSVARLNGLPIVGEDLKWEGILWYPFGVASHSLKKASMRIRPVSLGF